MVKTWPILIFEFQSNVQPEISILTCINLNVHNFNHFSNTNLMNKYLILNWRYQSWQNIMDLLKGSSKKMQWTQASFNKIPDSHSSLFYDWLMSSFGTNFHVCIWRLNSIVTRINTFCIGFRCKYRCWQVPAGVVTGVNKPGIKFWVDIVRGETSLRLPFLARY